MVTQNDVTNAWISAMPIPGYDPSEWRRDEFGNAIHYGSYGTTTDYGWEIDHRKPVSKGGTDLTRNLRALHWRANREKSDKY